MSEESHEAPPSPEDQEAVETTIAPPEQETSETFTDSPPQPDDPEYLKERFGQMHADYTRKTQSVAQERKELEAFREAAESWKRMQEDPDFHRQVLEAFGYELPDDEEDQQAYEPDQSYQSDPRIDMVAQDVAMLTEAEQERQAQQVAGDIHNHIAELSEQAGIKLTARQQAQLFRDAIDDGEPDPHKTESIFNDYVDDLRSMQGEWEKNWLSSKRGVPHIAQGGQQGQKRLDLSNKDERVKHLAAVMEAQEAQS